jgi:predicted acetyltransferase
MSQPIFTILTRPEVTPELDRQMEQLYQIAFHEDEKNEPEPDASNVEGNYPLNWFVLGRVGSELVTQLLLLTREIRVGDQKIQVVGIGGVGTHPKWRHRGYASALLSVAEEFIRKEIKVPFGLLVCAPATRPLYERAGWRYVADHLLFEEAGQQQTMDACVMILPLAQNDWPIGEINLCGSSW